MSITRRPREARSIAVCVPEDDIPRLRRQPIVSDCAFHFLGPATYVKHERELPMAITWRLATSLPGDLFATFAAAVA